MMLKRKKSLLLLSAVISVWFASLLAVYLPMSGWGTPTFPLRVDDNVMTLFLVMTSLSSLTCFLLGLGELLKLSALKDKIQTLFNTKK